MKTLFFYSVYYKSEARAVHILNVKVVIFSLILAAGGTLNITEKSEMNTNARSFSLRNQMP